MKITKDFLKQIIKEEIEKLQKEVSLSEGPFDRFLRGGDLSPNLTDRYFQIQARLDAEEAEERARKERAAAAASKKVDESSLNEENTLLKYPELKKSIQGGKINPELFIQGLEFYAENPNEVREISGKTKSAPADSFQEIFKIMDSFAKKNPTYSEKIKQLRGQIYPRYAKRAEKRASYDASRARWRPVDWSGGGLDE